MMNQGKYLAALQRIVFSNTSGSGSMQFVLVCTITHSGATGQWVEVDQQDRNVYLSMSGKAKDYTKKKLQSLGIGVDGPPEMVDGGDGDKLVVLPQGIGDEPLGLTCSHETYQGTARERWDLSDWGGGGTGSAASDEDAAKLKAMWG